jgi:hypothetical protein
MLIGVLFLIWKSIQGPQEKSEKSDILLSAALKQVQADLSNLRDNHVAHLDMKLQDTNDAVQKLAIELTRLNTILEERLPKKL